MNIALRGTEDQLSSSSTSMKHLRCSVILVQTNQKVSLMIWWLIKRSFDFWEFKPQTLFLKYRSCQLILCDSGLFLKSGQRLVVVFFFIHHINVSLGEDGCPSVHLQPVAIRGRWGDRETSFFHFNTREQKELSKNWKKKKRRAAVNISDEGSTCGCGLTFIIW